MCTEHYARSVAHNFIASNVLLDDEWMDFDTEGMISELAAAKLDGISPENYITNSGDLRVFRDKYAR
jgi:hypothetical protein